MSAGAQCPGCDRVLPDDIGKRGDVARCRRCRELFILGEHERLRTADDLWPLRVGLMQPGPLAEGVNESLDDACRASIRALGPPPGDILIAGLDDPAERPAGYRADARAAPVTLTLLVGPHPPDARSLRWVERSVTALAVAGVGAAITIPELALLSGGTFIFASAALALALRGMRKIPVVGPFSVFLSLGPGELRMVQRTLTASEDPVIRCSGNWVSVDRGEVLALAWGCESNQSASWLADVLRIVLRPLAVRADS